jgi:type II secretory pathway component PulC
MLKRKRIYLSLSAVLMAALAIAAVVFLMPAIRIPLDAKIRAPLDLLKEGSAPAGLPGDNASNHISPSAGAGNSENFRTANNPAVMELLKTSSAMELFGSYRLKGIIRDSSAALLNRAIIEDMNTGESRSYSISDKLPDNSQLVGIQRDYVTLQKNGVRKKLYIFSRYRSEGIQDSALLENTYLGYKKIGENEYVLKPYQVFKGDANRILDFSIQVSALKGRMEGVRITDIKNNALARELGLKEDDVLLEVNNESIHSLYTCFKASFNANHFDELQLKIRRGDRYIFLTYHLFWEGKGFWTAKDVLNSKAISSLLDFGFAAHLF